MLKSYKTYVSLTPSPPSLIQPPVPPFLSFPPLAFSVSLALSLSSLVQSSYSPFPVFLPLALLVFVRFSPSSLLFFWVFGVLPLVSRLVVVWFVAVKALACLCSMYASNACVTTEGGRWPRQPPTPIGSSFQLFKSS